jgi:hypothetical protein
MRKVLNTLLLAVALWILTAMISIIYGAYHVSTFIESLALCIVVSYIIILNLRQNEERNKG